MLLSSEDGVSGCMCSSLLRCDHFHSPGAALQLWPLTLCCVLPSVRAAPTGSSWTAHGCRCVWRSACARYPALLTCWQLRPLVATTFVLDSYSAHSTGPLTWYEARCGPLLAASLKLSPRGLTIRPTIHLL